MPISLFGDVLLLATCFSVCHGEVSITVTSGAREVTRQVNVALLRMSPYETSPAEPLSDESLARNFTVFMLLWILVVATVVSCNAWVEKPQLGCFSCLCCLFCPGGLFALCYPVDTLSTTYPCDPSTEQQERRPMFGRGNTTEIASDVEDVTMQILFSISGVIYVVEILYIAYAGCAGVAGGCATVFSATLILKMSLMVAILGIQFALHVMLRDHYTPATSTRKNLPAMQSLLIDNSSRMNLPASEH